MTDGMHYAPTARTLKPVCARGDFVFAAMALDHGHIFGMVANLVQAGGVLKLIYDTNPKKVELLRRQYPQAQIASSADEILQDPDVMLVAAAAIPSQRCELGLQVLAHGKDYFTDKTPFTSLDQLHQARQAVLTTGRKYACCYSERLQNEAAEYALELVAGGVIGDVIQVLGLGPHRLNAPARPDWFFRKALYGGIICDIGSHQAEQYLAYSGATGATVTMAHAANYANPDYPELEDFGEFSVIGDNGSSGYFRMDWFTPNGLRTWGDGRTTILGSKGYIELRKYVDIGQQLDQPARENNVYIVTQEGEEQHQVTGKIGFPFFGALILDCLERTELAMSQKHCFTAAAICLQAQQMADLNR
jgi:predicted dehydrogenase